MFEVVSNCKIVTKLVACSLKKGELLEFYKKGYTASKRRLLSNILNRVRCFYLWKRVFMLDFRKELKLCTFIQ